MTVFIYCLIYSLILFVSVALSFKLGELVCPIFEKHHASILKKEVDEFFKWVLSSENHSHDPQEVYKFSANLIKDSISDDDHSYRKCMIDTWQYYNDAGMGYYTKFSIKKNAKDAPLLIQCSKLSDVKTKYYKTGYGHLSYRKSVHERVKLSNVFIESKLIISPLVLNYFIDKTNILKQRIEAEKQLSKIQDIDEIEEAISLLSRQEIGLESDISIKSVVEVSK